MPFTTFDGRQLHYVDTGAPSDGSDRPALLFVHAYTCNMSLWDGLVARFAPDYRCLTFDLPGHGKSEPNDNASDMGFLADCAVAVLDAAGVRQAHVCGLSIGGMIGQHLGFSHAERVASLILACTTGKLATEAVAMWDDRLDAVTSKGMWTQIATSIERWYGDGIIDGFGAADLDSVAQMIATTSVAGAVSCGLAVKAHDVVDRLDGIRAPTLVIGADRDLSFTPDHPQALTAAISGATMVMLENAGHLAPVQVPDAFEHAMRGFLSSL